MPCGRADDAWIPAAGSAACTACSTTCPDGQYALGCGGTSAGTCAACATSCPAGQYLSGCGGSLSEDCGNVTLSAAYPPVVWACRTGTVSRLSYSNYESMSGIISGAAPLTLTFTQFDTVQGYDWVTVSSCTTADCFQSVLLLYRCSGNILPSPVTSSTGIIRIQWISDSIVTRQGWRATWSSPRSGQCEFLLACDMPLCVDSIGESLSAADPGCTACTAGTYSEAGAARWRISCFAYSVVTNACCNAWRFSI